MDARELLISWPGLDQLDAMAVLSHPAWRMPVGYEDDDMSLVMDAVVSPRPDELLLAITLDDAANVLGISDSPSYPDLHLLWQRRAELPEALVIALVEKEVGTVLQTVERFTRKELRLVGLAKPEDVGAAASRRSFRIVTPDGSSGFSLRVPADVVKAIGVLDNLDPSHASISSLTRPAYAEYAVIDADPDVVSTLKSGDFLLPEQEAGATWQTDLPDDSLLRLRDEAGECFTFAQFVSGELPHVPTPSSFVVYCHGRKVATAKKAKIGDASGYRIL